MLQIRATTSFMFRSAFVRFRTALALTPLSAKRNPNNRILTFKCQPTTARAREMSFDYAISNGFGGANASVLLRQWIG